MTDQNSSQSNAFSFFRTKAFRYLWIATLCLLAVGALRIYVFPKPEPIETFRVARDKEWTGYDIRGKENHLLGFTDEIVVAIAKQQGFDLEFVNICPKTMIEGLNEGRYDVVLASTPPDPQAKQKYAFSDPYYRLTPVVVVKDKSPYSTLKDLQGRSIAVVKNTPSLPKSLSAIQFNWFQVDSAVNAIDDLFKNQIDGVILDQGTAYSFEKGAYKGRIRVIPAPLTEDAIRMMAIKDTSGEDLIPIFNKGLEELKVNGTYQELLKKWELEGVQ